MDESRDYIETGHLQVVAAGLRKLQADGPDLPEVGICYHMNRMLSEGYGVVHGWREACFKRWDEWSGDRDYPVPHPRLPPNVAYDDADAYQMWSPLHPYGAARLRLLDFLIEEAETELMSREAYLDELG